MTVSIVKGVTPDGRVVTLLLNEDGSLAVGGTGGGGTTIGGATAANQDEQTALLEELRSSLPATLSNGKLSVDFPTTQAISADTLPLPSGAASEASLAVLRDRTPVLGQSTAALSIPVTLATDGLFATNFGSSSDTVAATDAASSSLIGLFKRLLTRFSSLLTLLPTGLSAKGRFLVDAAISHSAIAPTLFVIILTNANQEYSQAIANVKKIAFQVVSGGDIRYAYQSGNVASSSLPYYPLRVAAEEVEDFGNNFFSGTLYLASSTAGTIVIIKVWA